MIACMQVTHYPDGHGPWWTEDILDPTWEQVEGEISSMLRDAKPLVWLLKHRDQADADLLAVTGGEGVYHIQVADAESIWMQAVNPQRGDEMVEVWTSDQGFTTQARFTLPLGETLSIVKVYFEQGIPDGQATWTF